VVDDHDKQSPRDPSSFRRLVAPIHIKSSYEQYCSEKRGYPLHGKYFIIPVCCCRCQSTRHPAGKHETPSQSVIGCTFHFLSINNSDIIMLSPLRGGSLSNLAVGTLINGSRLSYDPERGRIRPVNLEVRLRFVS
jgi:hypothetical protein